MASLSRDRGFDSRSSKNAYDARIANQFRAQQQGWASPVVTFTQYYDAKPKSRPRLSEKRRKDPDTIQYCDLKPGDRIKDSDDGNIFIVNEIKDGSIVGEVNNQPFTWHANTELLADGDRVLLPPEKPRPKIKMEDVVVPETHREAIMDAIKQVDHHALIFDEWGFGDIFEKGTAVSMLFYGPPGTGKTLMAQAIADHYDYKLKVIGTAEIESSEPGQAERNIKAFFQAAEKDGKTVLLFDECDSLIHDRRAVGMILGAQINALLTCLENHKGIVIFTTNRLEKMDEAFDRRLSLKLEFEMPRLKERVMIWKRMFPEKAPLANDIDWDKLASVEITGGYIKNVVLRSARRAANSEEKMITHEILVDNLVEEVERMEQFQQSVASNTTPRMMGGGYTIRRG